MIKLLFLFIGFSASAQYVPTWSPNSTDTYFDAALGVIRKNPGNPVLDSIAAYDNENGFEFRRLKPISGFFGQGMNYNSITDKFDVTTVAYSGITDSLGVYEVTFPVSYSVPPNVQASIINGTNKQTIVRTVTTTGFSCYVQQRTDILGLIPSYSDVNGAFVDVIVTPK